MMNTRMLTQATFMAAILVVILRGTESLPTPERPNQLEVEQERTVPDEITKKYEALGEKLTTLEEIFMKVQESLKEICDRDRSIKAWCMLKEALLRSKTQQVLHKNPTKRSISNICTWPGFPRCKGFLSQKVSYHLDLKAEQQADEKSMKESQLKKQEQKPVENQVKQDQKPVKDELKPVENQVKQDQKPVKDELKPAENQSTEDQKPVELDELKPAENQSKPVEDEQKQDDRCIPGLAHCGKGKREFVKNKPKAKPHCAAGWPWCQH